MFVFAQWNHQIMTILLESPQREENLFPTASITRVSTHTTGPFQFTLNRRSLFSLFAGEEPSRNE